MVLVRSCRGASGIQVRLGRAIPIGHVSQILLFVAARFDPDYNGGWREERWEALVEQVRGTVLGFAIAGFGAWGQFHAQAVDAAAGAELRAIVSISDADFAAVRSSYPALDCGADLDAVLARDDIDVVSIVTPNALHEPMAIAALQAGKHVLLDKPMALTAAGCRRINQAAQAAGRTLNVVHELRLSAQYGRIREWIAAGGLGEPLCMHFALFRRSFRGGEADWRYRSGEVGSWMLEELVHYVDLALWYFAPLGMPVAVTANSSTRNETSDLSHNFSLTLRWESGAYAVLSQSLAGFEHHKVMEVTGTEGAARAVWSGAMDRSDQPTTTLHLLEGLNGSERFDVGTPIEVALPAGSGEVMDLNALVSAVTDGIARGESVISGAEGERVVRVCEAAEQAARTGSEVLLSAASPGN